MKRSVEQETVQTETYSFSKKDLLELIESSLKLAPLKDAKVRLTMQVPSGGDYSGQVLELGEDKIDLTLTIETKSYVRSDGK